MDEKTIIEEFTHYLIAKRKRTETIKTYVLITKKFLKVKIHALDKLDKDDIVAWEKSCIRYSNNSLTPQYGAVKRFIDFLIDENELDESMYGISRRRLVAPKKMTDEDNLEKLVMQPKQFNAVYDLAKKRNPMHFALFKTKFWCQLRMCESIGLKFSDINFDRMKVHIRPEIAKGGKEATINISPEAIEIIKNYRDNLRDEPRYPEYADIIFLRDGVPISETKMWEIHTWYGEKLKFHLTSHMWRHTGITEYAKVEKDLEIVRRQARHDSIKTTQKYINYANAFCDKSYFEKFANGYEHPPIETEEPDEDLITAVTTAEYKEFINWKATHG